MATYQWYADLRGPELQWADMVAVDTYADAIEKVNNKPDGVHFGWATLRMVDDDGAIYDATIGDYPEGLLPKHFGMDEENPMVPQQFHDEVGG